LVTIDGRPVPVRITGTPGAAGAVMGLGVAACREGLRLGAGNHTLTTARGKDAGFSIDRLVLASGTADEPVQLVDGRVSAIGPPAPAVPLVRVRHSGETKLRVHVSNATQPFWLVLGQSQSPGWQARIRGGKNLGGSELVDGYANGWLVTPTTPSFDVTLEWTPQRQVWAALWLSLLGVFLCLGLVAFTWRRRRVAVTLPHDDEVEIDWRAGAPLRGHARWIAIAASALLAAVVVTPWVGLLAGAAAWALTAKARLRAIVLFVPAALLLIIGIYIAVQQHRYQYPSVFEWPTLFPHARTPAWIAVVLLAADAVIDIVRRRSVK
jgi:arabinofuranan 3-O-arabinosyltransferase